MLRAIFYMLRDEIQDAVEKYRNNKMRRDLARIVLDAPTIGEAYISANNYMLQRKWKRIAFKSDFRHINAAYALGDKEYRIDIKGVKNVSHQN